MTVSTLISKTAYFLFIGILLVNLFQKKYGKSGERKRFATLYLGVAVLGAFLAAGAVIHSERLLGTRLHELSVLPLLAVIAYLVYAKRGKTLPFRFRCPRCGVRLPAEKAFFVDSNLCGDCEKKPEEDKS